MLGPCARSLDQALLASGDTSVRLAAARRLVPCEGPLGGWAALAWLGITAVDGRTGPGGSSLLPVPVCTGQHLAEALHTLEAGQYGVK